ncbi:ATP-binding cassette domain-containing protein [Calidifontibacter indicus]|uniref:ATP-binding cassette domain-containing protein n=1 Tax=Calidifontibacter indicus TaxID=419650 RepID=UPI003D7305AF
MNPPIELLDVRARSTNARGLTARLDSHQVIAIVGSSDADTSAVLRVIAGRDDPEHGTITGAPEASAQTWIARGNDLATVLTALENVAVPLMTPSQDPNAGIERAREMLQEVGLQDSTEHLVEELSGGQQQRVAVARALAQATPFLFAEDPTSALDARNRHKIHACLRRAADNGATVVLTASDEETATDIADQTLILDSPV